MLVGQHRAGRSSILTVRTALSRENRQAEGESDADCLAAMRRAAPVGRDCPTGVG